MLTIIKKIFWKFQKSDKGVVGPNRTWAGASIGCALACLKFPGAKLSDASKIR